MPVSIVQPQKWASRGLISGSPNRGKTLLLHHVDIPTIAVSMPDERGVQSLPTDGKYVLPLVVQSEPLSDAATPLECYQLSLEKYNMVLTVTRQILRDKYGKYQLFYADGLSKFYDLCMDIASEGRYLRGEVFESGQNATYTTRLYGHAHQRFSNYLGEIYTAQPERLFIATAWERLASEDENASEQQKRQEQKAGQRVWVPAFPGQMGYHSPGHFDWSIRAGLTWPQECDSCKAYARSKDKEVRALVAQGQHYTWQLRPYGDVQHVGVKGALRHMPVFLHQSWQNLQDVVLRMEE